MNTEINEIIDTLKEGQEITIVLKNGEQMTGLYRGTDDEQIILVAKSGNAPNLGWDIDDVEDIVPNDVESAGDVVTVDITDVKTGRKVAITLDLSGEECKATARFIPTAHKDDSGWYIVFASKFMQMLADSGEAE